MISREFLLRFQARLNFMRINGFRTCHRIVSDPPGSSYTPLDSTGRTPYSPGGFSVIGLCFCSEVSGADSCLIIVIRFNFKTATG